MALKIKIRRLRFGLSKLGEGVARYRSQSKFSGKIKKVASLLGSMDDVINLDSFEKSILSDIKGIKPKFKKRGYAKELVKKLSSGIEQALKNGCSYEEIAIAISNKKVKISPTTLKKYHLANQANGSQDKESKNLIDVQNSKEKPTTVSESKQMDIRDRAMGVSGVTRPKYEQKSVVTEQDKKKLPSIITTGASLTDDDYLDDFNDY